MGRYRASRAHYRKQQTALSPVGVMWWRAERYVVSEGAIRPAVAPERCELDLRDIEWGALTQWAQTCATASDLTPEVTAGITAWCARFGLPGYLLATTAAIALPCDGRWGEWTAYTRTGALWATERLTIDDVDPDAVDDRPSDGWLTRTSPPFALYDAYSYLDADVTYQPLGRLAAHLTCPVGECAQPGTAAFWRSYQEPVHEFLMACRVIQAGERTQQFHDRDWQELLIGQGWAWHEGGLPAATVTSLLSAYALQRVLGGAVRRVCAAKCGALIPSGRATRRYCSDRCKRRVQKARHRKKSKSKPQR